MKGVRRFPVPATGPFATIVACTDCPKAAEAIFDAQPGSLVVTPLHGCYGSSEGLLKNLELSTELGSKFILVMGHRQCMTLLHASEKFLASGEAEFPTLQQAAEDMGLCADAGFVCERAMTLNVIQTIQFLLASSGRLREQVQNGKLQIHGGMFDPFSGVVHFMGPIPGQANFLKNTSEPTEAAVQKTEVAETAETSQTTENAAMCEKAAFLLPMEDVVEKAGDSQASQETGTEGTGPGTDCGQSDPSSSWSTDVLRRESKDSEAAASGERLAEPETDQTSEADVKPLQPEESQVSQESSATTDAPSHISHASDSEHPDFLPNPAGPAPGGSNVTETAETAETATGEAAETETQDELGKAAAIDVEVEGQEGVSSTEATEDGKVLLGPYFSVAVDLWMVITKSRGVQLLRQNLLERLS